MNHIMSRCSKLHMIYQERLNNRALVVNYGVTKGSGISFIRLREGPLASADTLQAFWHISSRGPGTQLNLTVMFTIR